MVRYLERPFRSLREEAESEGPAALSRDRSPAERHQVYGIEAQLVPSLRALQAQIQGVGASAEVEKACAVLETRVASWQALQEALRDGNAERLSDSHQLWKQSEVALRESESAFEMASQASAVERVATFHGRLLQLTPRVFVTHAIIAINVAVFVLMTLSGLSPFSPTLEGMVRWGANYGPLTLDGQAYRLVSCMFLHFGLVHIGLNMWVLWSVGPLLERLTGNLGFLILYFATGIAGSLASLAWNPYTVAAGASGAVFGAAGGLLGWIVLRRDSIPVEVLKPMRRSLTMFVLINVGLGAMMPGIDLAAHLGGLVAGIGCGMMLSLPLATQTGRQRLTRCLILMPMAAAFLATGLWSLGDAPPDIRAELITFEQVEEDAIATNNQLITQAREGTLTEEEFAERIAVEILPSWRAQRTRMQELQAKGLPARFRFDELVNYMELREQAWQLQVEAIRERDEQKKRRANELFERIERMVQQSRQPTAAIKGSSIGDKVSLK